jgi:hypothetical protein
MVVHVFNPSYTSGGGRRMKVQDQPWAESARLCLRNKLKLKRTGGMTQVVKYLPSKCWVVGKMLILSMYQIYLVNIGLKN